MGQILEKFQGKQWREKQIRKIADKVFDHFKNETGKASLTFEDLYIAVLLVYNDINKYLPGPHFDPPSREQLKILMQIDVLQRRMEREDELYKFLSLSSTPLKCIIRESDVNLDGELDREEFMKFIEPLTQDTFVTVSRGLMITLAVAPAVALLTKRTTEGVPVVGKVVQKLPTSVYASLVTLAVVLFQKGVEAKE